MQSPPIDVLFSCPLLAGAVTAQQLVHYPDDLHGHPPQHAFPFYTPGAGATGNSVRVQLHCPDAFLQAVTSVASPAARPFARSEARIPSIFRLR